MVEQVGEFIYHKKDLIGHGAFAVVFKGHHRKKEDFVVAIKVIAKKNIAKTQNLLAKEIKILKELHHENVVSLFDCEETPNSVFLVMEYCNGGDLADYLRDKGTLSEDTIRIFLRQIASAMCTLQSKGVVHRDLKPQNLLLHHLGVTIPSPSEIKVKIADFGFARFLPGEMMAATLCGSPMYMAPEVIMSKAYDAKADLWSVGTIVYQCLTGKAPFQASSPQQLKKFYEKSKVISPSIPAGTSKSLKDLLVGLLRRNPKDRLDFGEFFSHPFLTGRILRSASIPVAVPAHQQKYSNSSHGTRSSSYSPNFGAEALGDIRVDLLPHMTPPQDSTEMSPQDPPIVMNISSPGNNSSVRQTSSGAYPQSPAQDDELAPEGFVLVPSNPEAPRVLQQRNPSDPLFPFYNQSPPRSSKCPSSPSPPLCRTPKRATFTVGSPYSTSPTPPTSPNMQPQLFHSPSRSPSSAESLPIEMPIRRRTSSSPGLPPRSEPSTSPVPIPRSSTMSGGFPSRQSSSRKSPSPTKHAPSTGIVQRKEQNNAPNMSVGQSPTGSLGILRSPKQDSSPVSRKEPTVCSTKGSVTPLAAAVQAMNDQAKASGIKQQALVGFSGSNISKGFAHSSAGKFRRALSNIEPFVSKDSSPILTALARQPNVALGVPITDLSEPGVEDKQMIRVHSCPAILAMGLPRGTLMTTPSFQIGTVAASPIYRRHSSNGSGSVKVKSPPSSPTGLPTIPGSPTKTSQGKESVVDLEKEMKPLKGLFTAGSPSPFDSDNGGVFGSPGRSLQNKKTTTGDGPAVVNQGTKVTLGFGESSSKSSKRALVAKETEVSSPDIEGPITLIAPELPEDTLMDTEHTEGVRKLNFVVSLVDAIREVISARGTPFTVLAESVAIRQNESFLADQIGLKSDELRKMEQLILYVKALKALNLSLLFAQAEIRQGHLKPSNAVKNVLNDLNTRYHQCLEKASELKQLVEPGIHTALDGKALTVNADRLMYHYAMEQCQNAALDELFGNPDECKKKYETAQVLLEGLEEGAHTDEDRRLLHKYKTAVDKRLACISKIRSRKSSQGGSRGMIT